ncbi:homeobox-domain-containing protein [Wolfiporia cocos MD-104 SS10]|uniref:Homeobox-domain-containing protein n=1 Tax=Wolfiporia cocos (strain MD-104) TaxID=742152 RepID=A0A2H3JNJ9_WOLCO|nr:homeobox-domain-containing protein [Wolfiporia cocos MD-104 SS10]
MSNPHDHFTPGCFMRAPRRSPAGGGNSNDAIRGRGGGLFNFGQGPCLFNTLDIQDPSHSIAYNESGWPANQTSGQHQYPAHAQTQYGAYPSRTDHRDRTLPPPNAGAPNASLMGGAGIRPPNGGYPSAYGSYPDAQMNPGYYPAPDPTALPPPIPQMGFNGTADMPPRRTPFTERILPSRFLHSHQPYPRNPSNVAQSAYATEPAAAEPTIKKKRKRADAEQLKVLNETYARTAFPSTEERAELAKRLNMSARSVQIWFQNKRQAMRQSSRQASANAPPTTNEPYPTTPNAGALPSTGMYGAPGSSTVGQPYGVPQPHPTAHVGPSPSPPGRHHASNEDPRRAQGRYQ